MRILYFIVLAIFSSTLAFAQTDGLSYQAVIIDNEALELPGNDVTGLYLSNGQVALRFTLYEHTGEILYQEIQETTTDAFGMVNLVIGQGEMTAESNILFTEIDWNGLRKDLGVEIRYENSDFEELSRQELLFLPYAFHRNITATGTLEVDGNSTFKGNLSVENESTTNLTGTLDVQGQTTLGADFTVGNAAPTLLTGDLDVLGETYFGGPVTFETITVNDSTHLNGPVSVGNQSPTELSGNLNVEGSGTLEGNLTVNATSALNGQVTINADVDGSQSSYTSYPLRVQGSNQGIAVRVDGNEAESKNFISFFNGFGSVKGRIEGQTLSELQSSFRFIWDVTMGGLNQAFVTAEGIACGGQLDFAEAGVMVANSALLGAQWVELTANYELNVGVAFLSGGADYAEWLELSDKDIRLFPGEVVGVKNGKVSKSTEGADHILAVSTNPIVLGNMPPDGKEHEYAKIAFLGQVPIRVAGTVAAGDYILPSGNGDGMAIAYSSSELPTNRFDEIIGVAWEDSENEAPALVNVALGLNKNDLAERVGALETELTALRREVESIKIMLNGTPTTEGALDENEEAEAAKEWERGDLALTLTVNQSTTMSEEDFQAWLADYGYIFEDQMEIIRKGFTERNIDYRAYEEIRILVDEPLEALSKMHSGEFLPTLWENFEKRLGQSGH